MADSAMADFDRTEKQRKAQSDAHKRSIDGLSRKRVSFLLWLIDSRLEAGTVSGSRDKLLFHLYNALAMSAGPDERDSAWQSVLEVNGRFCPPLPDRQMRAIRNAVDAASGHWKDRCGYYRYSDSKFADDLGLDEEELSRYRSLGGSSSRVRKREERRKRKQERQLAVRKKVADGIASGASNSEIAKSIGKSKRTVCYMKKAFGLKEMRNEEIIAYHNQGLAAAEITRKLKGTARQASRRTVERVLRSYREQQEQLKEETSD